MKMHLSQNKWQNEECWIKAKFKKKKKKNVRMRWQIEVEKQCENVFESGKNENK